MKYPIYILGVPRNFRGESLCKSLQDFGMTIEIVSGPEVHTDFDLIQKLTNNEYAKFTIRRTIKPQEVACCIGHIRMYQKFLESNSEWGVFLEDDAICVENPKPLFENLPILRKPCQIFLHDGPGTNLNLRTKKKDLLGRLGMIKRLDPQYGAYGYALNRASVELIMKSKVLTHINTPDWPYLWPKKIHFYQSDRVYFSHPVDMSMSIIGERINTQARLTNQLPNFMRIIYGLRLGIDAREILHTELFLKLRRLSLQVAKKSRIYK